MTMALQIEFRKCDIDLIYPISRRLYLYRERKKNNIKACNTNTIISSCAYVPTACIRHFDHVLVCLELSLCGDVLVTYMP